MTEKTFPNDYVRRSNRRLIRPAVLTVALFCLAVGFGGCLVLRTNFTMLPQDGELEPPSGQWERDAKAPWIDFGCSLLAYGLAGLVLLPFAFRFKRTTITPTQENSVP